MARGARIPAAGLTPSAVAAAPFPEPVAWALANGLATSDADGYVRLTTRGRLLGNEVVPAPYVRSG